MIPIEGDNRRSGAMRNTNLAHLDADDAARRILARKHEALAYLRDARAAGAAEDIEAWEALIRSFDKQLAQYGRMWN